MVSQDKKARAEESRRLFLNLQRGKFSSTDRPPPSHTLEIKTIHFFLHHNLNISRGSQWYLTTWRRTDFSPSETRLFQVPLPVQRRRRRLRRQHPCFAQPTSLMRNIFQRNRFCPFTFRWLHLNGYFETALSHDAGYWTRQRCCDVRLILLPSSLQTLSALSLLITSPDVLTQL